LPIRTNRKQVFAVLAPLLVIATTGPLFHWLAGVYPDNWRVGWHLGLSSYWLVWGGVFPLLLLGKRELWRLIRPRKPTRAVLILVAVPLLVGTVFKFSTGMAYEAPNGWVLLLLLSSALGNGIFEEILWRGVYLRLFPHKVLAGMIWPTLGFAMWHYVPGSMNPGGNVATLVIGAGLFGFYLAYLARKTGTIWWGIVVHVLGGVIMVT
jgi:membrane protease YdiL (CAAX protease family)